MNMIFEKRLAIPAEVKEQYPLLGKVGKIVEEKRAELRAVFEGRLDKLLLIIGPCSADNEEAVIDYMNRLVPVQEKVRDKILMVPRIYTNKPRTTGEGWLCMSNRFQRSPQMTTPPKPRSRAICMFSSCMPPRAYT